LKGGGYFCYGNFDYIATAFALINKTNRLFDFGPPLAFGETPWLLLDKSCKFGVL